MKNHTHKRPEPWFLEVQRIAALHNNSGAVRDYEGWLDRTEDESPEEAYYSKFPEHKPTVDYPVIGL
ncbi:hypothetical protein [Rhodoferax antarcticus]|uniref:hypothetical protein n=1 Tax=Rhodoferax antarcticus TaxID=81479 RepID=UPI00094FED5D|nr:hypothetical protein [Rhodoferax antarcticus]